MRRKEKTIRGMMPHGIMRSGVQLKNDSKAMQLQHSKNSVGNTVRCFNANSATSIIISKRVIGNHQTWKKTSYSATTMLWFAKGNKKIETRPLGHWDQHRFDSAD